MTRNGMPIYLRPGERIKCSDGLVIKAVSFGRGHCKLLISKDGCTLAKRKRDRVHVVTFEEMDF